MPGKTKTIQTEASVKGFLDSNVENAQKKEDCLTLIDLMSEWSGLRPKMWGEGIIGFGSYHYAYESGREGDLPLLGFSPRKTGFSVYVSPTEETMHFFKQLGKVKIGTACIQFKKLSDIDIAVLKEISLHTVKYLLERKECACRIKHQKKRGA